MEAIGKKKDVITRRITAEAAKENAKTLGERLIKEMEVKGQELETPFIIAGKNIRKSGLFNESMMQFDCASTIAALFGLQQPQVWVGRPMKQVFK